MESGRNNHYLLTIKNVWNDACYEEIHILEEKKQQRKKKQPKGKKAHNRKEQLSAEQAVTVLPAWEL